MGLDFLPFCIDMAVVLQRGKEMGAMFPFQKEDSVIQQFNHSLAGSIQMCHGNREYFYRPLTLACLNVILMIP
jgi:hypothetical protein